MSNQKTLIKPCGNGVHFFVLIQPQSSKNEVTGIHNDVLKMRLTAPPVEGLANKSFMRFFAKWVGVSPSKVNIIQRLSSKNKTIVVTNPTEKQFRQILKNKNLAP